MIYPEKFPFQITNHAEQLVFHALEKLGDGFDIFYNKSFARKHSKEALLYEVDFLVFDLRGGRLNHIFVIEVKGGSMSFNSKHNQWKSGENNLEVSPEQQAMGYVKNLIARYYSTVGNRVPLTWLLWFPDGLKGKREYFPSHLSFWRIVDQYALSDPLKYLDSAIDDQGGEYAHFPGASMEDYQENIKKELTQTFTVSTNLKSLLEEMQISFEQLEAQQKIFFNSLLGISRLAMEGCAGSGKSFLAKCAAHEFSALGKATLFICFNRFLKDQILKSTPKDVHIDTVLNFMMEYIEKKDKQWIRTYQAQDQKQLEIDIPKKFNQILKSGPVQSDDRYDTIIIDEGQDMDETWIKNLLKFLKNNKSQVLIFFDPKQNIFNRSFDLPKSEEWTSIKLCYNHRNAKSINSYIYENLSLKIKPGNVPEGLPVKIKSYREETLLNELDSLLLQLIRIQRVESAQITLLVDGSTKDWDLENKVLSSGFKLEWLTPGVNRDQEKIYLTSVNHFKGSESEIIILLLKESLLPIKNENIRYTQMSRAKAGLWILEKN